jgi:polysaccharide biosynthesis/export protein
MLIFVNRISIKDSLMKFTRTVLLLAFPFYFFSCVTQKPLPNYLENVRDTGGKKEVVVPELRIQKNDNLSIQIYSASVDPRADDIYNLRTPSTTSGGGTPSVAGILVDGKGNIEYPRLGSIHAEGMTKDELAAELKKRLTEPVELLKDPTVIIRFLNFKVAVLGEVKNPGVMTIPGERVTILEAIGLAGDVDEFGMKDQVKVMREIDGHRQIGIVDLSSDSLFTSPFYNLVQNDVVMVPPTRRKAKKTDQEMALQRAGFALSVITAIALLYGIFR